MTSTFLILSLAATVIYIFWVLLEPRKKSSRKKTARKQISKKTQQKIKGKENKQQALDRIESSITYAENAVEMICNY